MESRSARRRGSGRRRPGRRRSLIALAASLVAVALVGVIAGGAVGNGSADAQRLLAAMLGGATPLVATFSTDQAVPVDPARFAAGACVAYPPRAGAGHRTVFLDAGHGGLDPGSVGVTESGGRIYEANETLPVELDAATMLEARGFRVVVSRTRAGSGAVARLGPADRDAKLLTAAGVHADVGARAICANEAHAQVLIGIYFDAGASYNAGSVTGYDTSRPFTAENLRLARLVQSDTLAAMNAQGWRIPSEGIQPDDGLGSAIGSAAQSYGHLLELGPAKPGYFATPSLMPGAVIEPLFITDPFEGSIADSVHGQQVIASGIARAVEQFFRPAP